MMSMPIATWNWTWNGDVWGAWWRLREGRSDLEPFQVQFQVAMGIDIIAGGRVKKNERKCKSDNPYLTLLCKLYKFLSRRTDAKFNKVVYKRLNMARRNKAPMSIQ